MPGIIYRPIGDTNRIFQCDDFSGISTALYRGIGLPARQVVGRNYQAIWNAFLQRFGPAWNYHVWNEVWLESSPDTIKWKVFDFW